MKQMQKQRTKRAIEVTVLPTAPASDTSDAAELLARLDEILEG